MSSKMTAGRLIAAGMVGTAVGSMVGAGILISKTLIRPNGTSDAIIEEFADTEKMKAYEARMAPVKKWAEAQTFQNLYLYSSDGLKLHALYLPAKAPTDKCIILLHGFTSMAMHNVTHAKFFHDMGYEVIMLDLRAHGESEGLFVGFGILDRFDTERWLKFAIDKFGPDMRYVLHGTSMGATTALMALGVPFVQEHVSAVIADCAFTSPKDIFSHVMKKSFHVPPSPFMEIGGVYSQILAGYKFSDYSTIEALKNNEVPVLFIHGGKDKFVPTWMSDKNYESATCKKRLLVVEEGGHGSSAFEDPELYQNTEKEFLDEVLN